MADKKTGVNSAAAGVAGALVGAVVGAAAVALTDKKTRKQVLGKLNELKLQAGDQFSDLRSDLQKWVEESADGVMGSVTGKEKKQITKGKSKKPVKSAKE